MRAIFEFWRKTKSRQKLQLVIVITFIIITGFILIGLKLGFIELNEIFTINGGELIIGLATLILAFFTAWLGLKSSEDAGKYRDLISEKNQIEDLRNTLEKGLGPIYSIMNYSPIYTMGLKTKDGNTDYEALKTDIQSYKIIRIEDKKIINEILSKYPHMFSPSILDSWKIYNKRGVIIDYFNKDSEFEIPYIPIRFKELIDEEYKKILSEYNNKLLKK